MREPAELLVVSYFGTRSDSLRTLLSDQGIQVRHVPDLAALQNELDGSRPDAVLVDRWLLNDEAAACVSLVRAVHGLPALLMVATGEIAGGRLDFPEAVDGVLEKPIRAEPLIALVRQVEGKLLDRPEDADSEEDGADGSEEPPRTGAFLAGQREESPPAEGDDAASEAGRGHGAFRLLDEVRETLRRLGEVIKVDTLSGLLYRDYFLDRVGQEVKRAIRYEQPLSALMIDIDDFKAINDQHGHEVGNDVLAALGDRIQGTIRKDLDVASRLYGDEFCVVLPNTGLAGAGSLADRLHEMLASEPGPVPIAISIGVHCLTGGELGEDGVKALLDGADQAMLRAKRETKTRKSAVDPDPDPDSDPASFLFGADKESIAAPPAPDADSGSAVDPFPAAASSDLSPGRPVDATPPPRPREAACPGAPVDAEPRGPVDGAGIDSRDSKAADAAAAGSEPTHGGGSVPDAQFEEDVLSAALADAVGALAEEEDLKKAEDFRGKVLLVNREREVAEILVDFLGSRGIPVETAPDFPAALTLVDTLEYFLVLADARPESAETTAFCEAVHRIDSAIFLFLFIGEAMEPGHEPALPNLKYIRKPFLLSDLYLQTSRAREDYHLRQMRGEAAPGAGSDLA